MGVFRGNYSYLSPGRGINLTPPMDPKNRVEGPAYNAIDTREGTITRVSNGMCRVGMCIKIF